MLLLRAPNRTFLLSLSLSACIMFSLIALLSSMLSLCYLLSSSWSLHGWLWFLMRLYMVLILKNILVQKPNKSQIKSLSVRACSWERWLSWASQNIGWICGRCLLLRVVLEKSCLLLSWQGEGRPQGEGSPIVHITL